MWRESSRFPRSCSPIPSWPSCASAFPPTPDEIVLGRRIAASGRTSAFVQRRSASASDLRALGSRLLAFYGQHEHRRLVLSSAQLEILDGFAGAEQLERRGRYRDAHAEVVALSRELAALAEREGARERDLDLFRFELAEIEAAAPDPDEERELEAERDRLRHAEGLRAAASGALAAIAGADDDAGRRARPPGRGRARPGGGGRGRRLARRDRRAGPRGRGRARRRGRARFAPTWRGSTPSPVASSWSRSVCTRSTA